MGSYCRSGKSVLVSRSFRNENIMSFFGHIVSSYLSHHIRMRKMAKWQRKLSVNYCGNFYRTLTPKNNKKPSTSKWIEIVWNDLTNSSTSSSIFISKSIAVKFPWFCSINTRIDDVRYLIEWHTVLLHTQNNPLNFNQIKIHACFFPGRHVLGGGLHGGIPWARGTTGPACLPGHDHHGRALRPGRQLASHPGQILCPTLSHPAESGRCAELGQRQVECIRGLSGIDDRTDGDLRTVGKLRRGRQHPLQPSDAVCLPRWTRWRRSVRYQRVQHVG